jgi:hypothetical protein
MKMNFVQECKNLQARNAPVENAVVAHAEDIRMARAQDVPLNVIYKTLKLKDAAVGKGYSSFRQAVARLDKRGWPEAAGAYSVAPRTQPTPTVDSSLQHSPNLSRFGDKSRTSAF